MLTRTCITTQMFFLCLQEFYNAFHKDKDYVKKFLKPLYIGDAEEYQQSELVKDFAALRATAEEMVLESHLKLFA